MTRGHISADDVAVLEMERGLSSQTSAVTSRADDRPLILHVIHHLVVGGMENGLVNLVNRLPESRYRHAIACIDDFSEFRLRVRRPDVEVYALNRPRLGVWRTRANLYRLCSRLRPAIVHTRNISGLDALLPARLAGVSYCVHGEHGWDVNDLDGNRWKPALLRRLHSPLVHRYVTVSKHLERYLITRVGIAPARITQIYNGVDTDRFSPAMQKPIGVLPAGFADGRIVVGTVGRIQSVKDQASLVRAFAMLVQRHAELASRVRLVVAGDGAHIADLRALVTDLGIDEYAWLPGAVDDVPMIFKTFDIFVLPSLAEGISNTILEAMATGLPVVATAVGGNIELVDDGETGRLYVPRDIGDLALILNHYVNDSRTREAHGRQGRRRALEKFSIDAMIDHYHRLYTSLFNAERNSDNAVGDALL